MQTYPRGLNVLLPACSVLVAILLTGCGSSGGGGGGTPSAVAGTVMTGCACAGAPVVGFVEVRDSSTKPQPVLTNIPIQANGLYSVDVTGLKPPLAFLATGTVGGRNISLYSASSTLGGTVNITPFTDLMIRSIAASAVDNYVNTAAFSGLTTAQLDAERIALTTALTPALTAMGLSSSIDLLRATFNADGTGLDRFMDVVKVSTNGTTATITNILDAANTLIINTQTGASTGNLGTGGLAQAGTPLDQITQMLHSFASFFATSLPNPTNPTLLALFTSTFLDDGESLSAFLTDITTDPSAIGLHFTNIVVDSIDTGAGTALVHFSPVDGAGVCLAHDLAGCAVPWQFRRNNNGVWQAHGNQRIAEVKVRTRADQQFCSASFAVNFNTCSPSGKRATGLHLNINNQGLQPIGSAVVTGPGLPQNGVTLTAQPNQQWLMFASSACTGCTTNFFAMTDSQIQQLTTNSTYTVKLFDTLGSPTPLATYTEVVPVPPVLNTALSGVAFPTVSNVQNLANVTATTLAVGWAIPSGLFGDIVSVFMYQNNQSGQQLQNINVRADLTGKTGTSGTSTLAITPPSSGAWTNGTYFIGAFDQYGGQVSTQYLQ